jgi:hypothetical protein
LQPCYDNDTKTEEKRKDAGQTKEEESTPKEIHEKQEVNKDPDGSRHRQCHVSAATPRY